MNFFDCFVGDCGELGLIVLLCLQLSFKCDVR